MKRLLPIFALLLLLVGCKDGNYRESQPKEVGGLTIDLGSDTKAAGDMDINDFKVVLRDKDNNEVESWARYSDMPKVVIIEEGVYTLDVTCANYGHLVGFDTPVYQGYENIAVEPRKLNEVKIECRLINMEVTVKFSEDLYTNVKEGFRVVVSSEDGALIFKDDETRHGYFMPKPLTISFEGNRKSNNSEIIHTVHIDKVSPKDHHIVTVYAESAETGTGSFDIKIDYTTNDKNVGIIVPDEDEGGEEPGPDPGPDPDQTPPAITGGGIDSPLVISDQEAADMSVPIDVAITTGNSGIAELWVDLDSPLLTDDVLGLVNLTRKFDLANVVPGSPAETTLKGLGIIGDKPIKGLKEFTVSIGGFMMFLDLPGSEQSMEHNFHVTVKDGNGQELSKTVSVVRVHQK